MSPLSHILVVSAIVVAAATLALGITLVARKAVVVIRRLHTSEHAARYRVVITGLLLAEDEVPETGRNLRQWTARERAILRTLCDELQGPRSGTRRSGLLEVLAEMSRTVRGETLERVTLLYEQCGFVRQAMHDLRSRSWWVRARACRDLGNMRSRRALFALLERLQDPAEEVRQEASLALVQIVGAGEALSAILQEVREINPWFALRLSVAVNAAAGEALEPLVRALTSRYASVRHFAVLVLGEVKDPSTVPALLAALSGAATQTRVEIFATLGKIGDARALPVLLAGLDHTDGRVRKSAIAALGDLGTPSVTGRLAQVIRSGAIEERRVAAAALVRLRESLPLEIATLFPDADPTTSGVLLEALDDAGLEVPDGSNITRGAA